MTPEKAMQIAQVCHEANRAWCEATGDFSQAPWQAAPQWQVDSAVDGVLFRAAHPEAGPEASHDNWSATKIATGWVYGPEKDPVKKTHPCLVPFGKLPPDQQAKDKIFAAIVAALI